MNLWRNVAFRSSCSPLNRFAFCETHHGQTRLVLLSLGVVAIERLLQLA